MALAEQDAAAAATTVAARLGAFPVNEAQIQPIVGGGCRSGGHSYRRMGVFVSSLVM